MIETFSRTEFFSKSLCVALLIPFTFFCTGLNIFVSNAAEMEGTITTLIPPLFALLALVALLFFLTQLPYFFIRKHQFIHINLFLFGIGFLLWFQANIFNWNLGELDGAGVDWTTFRPLIALEIVIYAIIIGLIIWQRQWLSKYVVHIACVLMVMQAVPLAVPVTRMMLSAKPTQSLSDEPSLDPAIPAWKQYEFIYDGFFDYSKERNVVLIIPDAFGADIFERLVKKHPEVLDWFADFNYFPKHKAQEGRTAVNVAQILTACEPEESRHGATVWNTEGALQKTLTAAGFQTRLHTVVPSKQHYDHRWVSNIRLIDRESLRKKNRWYNSLAESGLGQMCDLAIVRSAPIICKPADTESFSPFRRLFNNLRRLSLPSIGDIQFAQHIIDSPATNDAEKPVCLVIHINGVHAPHNMNETFEFEPMPGIDGEDRQAFAVLLLIQRLIEDIKAAEVYDNTLIVITGDHGSTVIRENIGGNHREMPFGYNPLLLIKRENERHDTIVYRNEYTNVQDITPTILDLVGLENLPGRFSVFDIPPGVLEKREIEYESFWSDKRGDPIVRFIEAKEKYSVSSEIVLRRSEMEVYAGRLRYFVGDNLDTWNNNAVIVLTHLDEQGDSILYWGKPSVSKINSIRHRFWYSYGILDVSGVADGKYEVAFLLPQKNGSYVKNVLGEITTAAEPQSFSDFTREATF